MKNLLIVDDDIDFAALLEEILSSIKGIEVSIDRCYDGACVIEKVEKQPVDMIILDYYLPSMTGLEIVQELHKKNYFPSVIMVTAYGDRIARERARELEVTAFLEKPFDIKILDYYVHKCFDETE